MIKKTVLRRILSVAFAAVTVAVLAACAGNADRPADTAPSTVLDTAPLREPAETAPSETQSLETEPPETHSAESKPADTEPAGTEPIETEAIDTEPIETEPATEPLEVLYRDPRYTVTESGASAKASEDTYGGMLFHNELLEGDFSVELHVTPTSVKANAGILFLASPEEDGSGFEGYAFTIHENTVYLYQVTHNTESGIAVSELAHRVVSVNLRTLVREGCTLRVEREGNTVRCFYCDDADGIQPWPEFEYVLPETDACGMGYFDNGRAVTFGNPDLAAPESRPAPDLTYQNPVFGASGADPGVLYHDGTYYLYSTNYISGAKGYPVYTSPNLVDWEFAGMCTGELWSTNFYWAPEVVEKDGRFYMIATNNVSLGIAVADSPLGPFEPAGELLLEQAIDGNFFFDDDGKVYLYYVNVKEGEPYGIFGCELTEDLLAIKPNTTTLLLQYSDPWEATTVEAPEMIKHNGIYYLTYSGNTYTSEKYAIGYATSDSPLGEFERYNGNPILSYTSEIQGTGHHCFTTSPDGNELWIVYHIHSAIGVYEPRTLCIDRVRFTPTASGIDRLEAYGPTHTPQPLPAS